MALFRKTIRVTPAKGALFLLFPGYLVVSRLVYSHSTDNDLDAIAVLGLIIGTGLFMGAFSRHIVHWRMKITATSKVRSMAIGLVELSGTAENMKPMVDPIY